MSIELNAAFRSYVNFADQQIEQGNKKAVARDDAPIGLGDRNVRASVAGEASFDKAYAFSRNSDAKAANRAARAAFMNAVADIFGGEEKIPASVRSKMTNMGTDKPLTARRIKAVAVAVDNFRQAEARKLARPLGGLLNTLYHLGAMDGATAGTHLLAVGSHGNDFVRMTSVSREVDAALANCINARAGLDALPDANAGLRDQTFRAACPVIRTMAANHKLAGLDGDTPGNVGKLRAFIDDVAAELQAKLGAVSTRGLAHATLHCILSDEKLLAWARANPGLLSKGFAAGEKVSADTAREGLCRVIGEHLGLVESEFDVQLADDPEQVRTLTTEILAKTKLDEVPDEHLANQDKTFRGLVPKLRSLVVRHDLAGLKGETAENAAKLTAFCEDMSKVLANPRFNSERGRSLAVYYTVKSDPELLAWARDNHALIDNLLGDVIDERDDYIQAHPELNSIRNKDPKTLTAPEKTALEGYLKIIWTEQALGMLEYTSRVVAGGESKAV